MVAGSGYGVVMFIGMKRTNSQILRATTSPPPDRYPSPRIKHRKKRKSNHSRSRFYSQRWHIKTARNRDLDQCAMRDLSA